MATPHIEAETGDIAPLVLMSGDPLRAKYIAETYLEKPKVFNEVRNMLGYTGIWKGERVSVMGSGMGIPSISIYVEELCRFYGVQRIMRVGTCGAIQEHLALKDLVIAVSACTDSAVNSARFFGASYAPTADFPMAVRAAELAKQRGMNFHAGTVVSTDIFYAHEGDLSWKVWADYGALCLEMETAGLYTIAAKHKVRALTVLTVSDSLVSKQAASSKERERSYTGMMETALDTIIKKC